MSNWKIDTRTSRGGCDRLSSLHGVIAAFLNRRSLEAAPSSEVWRPQWTSGELLGLDLGSDSEFLNRVLSPASCSDSLVVFKGGRDGWFCRAQ